MGLSNPVAKQVNFFPDVSVFAGAAPLAFQDLNMSAAVGAVDCLVYLEVDKTAHAAPSTYNFREDGATDGEGVGVQTTSNLDTVSVGHVVVKAIAGIVEWKGNNADAVDVRLKAYAKG